MGSTANTKTVMRRQTSVNGAYIRDDLRWQLQWTMSQIAAALEAHGGVGEQYLYRLIGPVRQNTTLDTVDALYNAILARFLELGLQPPDDLWNKLLVEEWIEVPLRQVRNGTGD